MPRSLTAESAESVLQALGEALDLVDVGILLLDHELRTRFVNRRQAELFCWSPALLASRPAYRDLLTYAAANVWFPIEADELPEFIDRREAAVHAGFLPPTRVYLKDGRRVLLSCVACPDGGRILTCVDISQELLGEATEATEISEVEMRFRTRVIRF